MMSEVDSTDQTPRLDGTEAIIYVSDFVRARDYYVARLGFMLEFAYGSPLYFGLVARDGARLCLRLVRGPVFVGDVRERERLLSATFTLGSAAAIRSLFQEFLTAGVDFSQELKTEPWGATTFVVRDPDGNHVLFAAPAL